MQPLADRISAAPIPHDEVLAQRYMGELKAKCAGDDLADLRTAIDANPKVGALLRGVFGCSPYLTSLIIQKSRRPHGLSRRGA